METNQAITYLQQAQNYCAKGFWEEAVATCEKALAYCRYQLWHQKPGKASPQAYLELGNQFREQQQLEQAISCYRQAIQLNPQLVAAYQNLGRALAAQEKWQEAVLYYHQAVELSNNNSRQEEESTDGVLRKEAEDISQNPISPKPYLPKTPSPQNPIECYQKELAIQPESAEVHANLGSAYAQQQDWQQAIIYYKQALDLDPQMAGVHRNLARVFTQTNQPEAAAQSWFQALSLEPSWAQVEEHLKLGNTLREQDKTEQAQACYRRVLKLQPDSLEAYQNLGELLTGQEQIDLYRQGVKEIPDNAQLQFQLGQVLAAQSRWQGAVNTYREAIKLQSENGEWHHYLGDALVQLGKEEEAIESWQQALELNPDLGKVHLKLGNIWRKEGKVLAAANSYLRALELEPDLQEPYVALRCNLLRYEIANNQDFLAKVIASCRRIIEQKPHHLLAQSTLGYALTKQGNLDEAIQIYQTASLQQATKLRRKITDQQWAKATRKAPAFIVIGAEKCGTTSLYHYLNQHPQILPSVEKELDFFDLEFTQGNDWYLAHFPPIPQEDSFITGESSANYIYHPQAAARIKECFPETKLIVILRNPIDRTVSRYHMLAKNNSSKHSIYAEITAEIQRIKKGIKGDVIPWQVLNRNRNIGNSLYMYHLKPWLSIFPREQFLILKSEDLFARTRVVMNRIFDFIGLPNYSLSEYRKYNTGTYLPLESETRQILADFFSDYNQQLEDILSIEFNWN